MVLARQGEVEAGAAVDGGFGPDFTAVAVDDALDGGEADAGAWELGLGVEALKGAEELGGAARVEAEVG